MGVVPQHESTMHFQPDGHEESLLDEHEGRSHSTVTLAQKPVPSVVSAQKQLRLSWQVTRVGIPPGQIEAQLQSPSVSVLSGGQLPWHTPRTHCSPSSQRWKQRPQWRSLLCRFTQLPLQQVWFDAQRFAQLPQWPSLVFRFTHLSPQRLWPGGQPQTLSSPCLMQFFEQHWESLLHSLPKRLQSLAQATPGTEAKAAPRRAPPIHLIALPLESVPVASPLARSSKDRLVVCWLTCCPHSPKGGTLGD